MYNTNHEEKKTPEEWRIRGNREVYMCSSNSKITDRRNYANKFFLFLDRIRKKRLESFFEDPMQNDKISDEEYEACLDLYDSEPDEDAAIEVAEFNYECVVYNEKDLMRSMRNI